MHQQQTAFENIVDKGEIAHNEQFLLFPKCFLLNQINCITICPYFDIISLFAAGFEKPKICISGKGLIVTKHMQVVANKLILECIRNGC